MSKKDLAVIILAAGKGTRMKSSLPKVLHKICNKPMVNHVIDASKALNPNKIISVINSDMQEISDNLKDISEIAIQTEQLGTAHAVKPAIDKLKGFEGNIIILYADTPLIKSETLSQMIGKLDESSLCVLGFTPEDPAEYGRLITNENDYLQEIVEFKDANEDQRMVGLCNSGVIAITSDSLFKLIDKIDNNNAKGEYYLTDLVDLVNQDNNKCSYILADENEVLGVNNRKQLSDAEYLAQSRLREQAMLSGATLLDPETVYFSHDTKIGQDVTIEPNVFFGLGVVIADNVHIKANSHIEGTKIAQNCIIGPFARLRPNTNLQENVKIGNFVEVKKSDIGKASKVNHLSYIGDSSLGQNVNVGAGTITCNYDGKNKFKTQIQDNAFIGSNTALVAPVTIGENSLIGAGSTITKDIENNMLAVTRAKLVKANKG